MNCANENQGIQRNIRRILSDNLKRLRKEKSCSQECVANDLFMSCSYYREIEHGRVNPTVDVLEKLAGYFGVSVSELSYVPVYHITEEKILIDGEIYTTYGIKSDKECVPDISADREEVEKLTEHFNNIMLPPALLHKAIGYYVDR